MSTEYINKDYYYQIPYSERHFIKLSQAAAYDVIERLKAEGIPFSATVSPYRSTVTVSRENAERAEAISRETARPAQHGRIIIGNTNYSSIRDRRYIETDSAAAMQLAGLLSGNSAFKYSGVVYENGKATVTVSGDKNAAEIRRLIDNINNMDILEVLDRAGFERISDKNGFVNIRNTATEEVCGFSNMDMVRDMWNDPSNDFFHVLNYRIDYAKRDMDLYYISQYTVGGENDKSVYRDNSGNAVVFKSVDEAVEYVKNNDIHISNESDEITAWQESDRQRENEEKAAELSRLADRFPVKDGMYPDYFIFNKDSGSFTWVYFNPDGDGGKGEFSEKTVYEDDIYAAYRARISADNDEAGRNAFLGYLNSCTETVIDTDSPRFAAYAESYISPKSEDAARYYGIFENSAETENINAVIKVMEDSVSEIAEDKARRAEQEKAGKNIVDSCYDKLKAVVFENENVKKAIADSDFQNAHIEALDVMNKEAMNIFNKDIYGNIDFYANFFGDKMTDRRIALEKYITDTVRQSIEARKNVLAADSSDREIVGKKIDAETAHQMWENGFDVYADGKVIDRYDFKNYDNVIKTAEIFGDEGISFSAEENDTETNYLIDAAAEIAMDFNGKYVNIDSVLDNSDWIEFGFDGDPYNRVRNALAIGDFKPVTEYFDEVWKRIPENDNRGIMRWNGAAEALDKLRSILPQYLGRDSRTAYYFFPDSICNDDLWRMRQQSNVYAVAAPAAAIAGDFMKKNNIHFYKIGRDINPSFESFTTPGKKFDMLSDRHLLETAKELSRKADKPFTEFTYDDVQGRTEEEFDRMKDLYAADLFQLYQAKTGEEYRYTRFTSLDELSEAPDIADYDLVYTGYLSDHYNGNDVHSGLESLFTSFTTDRPADFKGRSISTGDVIVLHGDTPYYVDSIGFKTLTEDFLKYRAAEKETDIAKGLGLENSSVNFSVISFDGGEDIVVSGYVDSDSIGDIEPFADYADRENVSVRIDNYNIGSGESEDADEKQAAYIQSHLDDVLKNAEPLDYFDFAVHNEIDAFALDTDKAYVFSEIRFETGEVYYESGEISDGNITETAAYKEIFNRYTDRNNIEDLDDNVRVTVQTYRYGSGEDTIPNDEETAHIRENYIDVINRSERTGQTEFFTHFWKNVDDVLYGLAEAAEKQHRENPSVSDSYFEKTYILPENPDNEYPDFYTAAVQIKLTDREWLSPEEAVKAMQQEDNFDISRIEMLNIRTVNFDGTTGEMDMTPEIYSVLLNRTEKNFEQYKAAVENLTERIGRAIPIYANDVQKAAELGETDRYFSDLEENRECTKSIDYAISLNHDYKTYSFNAEKAITDLMQRYSVDRIAHVTAARVFKAREWDKRFDKANVEWAKNQLEGLSERQIENASRYGLNAHSVLLNDFADTLRKGYERFKEMETAKSAVAEGKAAPAENLQAKQENDKSYEPKLGDKFRDSKGEMWEITSLTGVLPWYTDQCAIENISGNSSFAVTKNETYSDLLDEQKYTYIPEKAYSLIKKVDKELADFLAHSDGVSDYEINTKKDLAGYIRYNSLDITDSQYDALLSCGDTLYQLYDEWVGKDYDGYEDIAYIISDAADALITANKNKVQERETPNGFPAGNPDPHINDTVEFEGSDYRITNISGDSMTLQEADTLIPTERKISVSDFMNKGYSLIQRDETEKAKTTEELFPQAGITGQSPFTVTPGAEAELQNSDLSEAVQDIKNLAELKRALTVGTEFEITSAVRDGVANQRRQVNYADTTGIYSIRPDAPDDKQTTLANGGRGSYLEFGKSADWSFKNGVCIYYRRDSEHIRENELFSVSVKQPVINRERNISEKETDSAPAPEKAKLRSAVIDLTTENQGQEHMYTSEKIPATPKGKNYVITDDNYGVMGGAKSRYAANIEAIKTLKAIEAEKRTATPVEQEILSRYTGWGAVAQAFDENNDKWSREYEELSELLTPAEYAAARKSTMNAHYTSPTVISAIYEGLDRLGFEKGKILEPAMGIGNFFGMLPEKLSGSSLYGVELDSLTGRIAQQLYPNADIQIKGFEKTEFPDNSFDVAIGNVPFGEYKLFDKVHNDSNFLIHDYFVAKALDKVHSGGIVAFVTSKGTMDKENTAVREYIAQRAELLGAIRLPNNAFKDSAGTEVTSDIIFLQKRDRPIEIVPAEVEWIGKSKTADGLSVNNYFVQHPEMVLGKITEGNRLYGNGKNDTSCIPIEGANLKTQLAEAVKHIKGTYRAAENEIAPESKETVSAPAGSRKFSYQALNGDVYFRESGSTMTKCDFPKDRTNRILAMTALRDNVHELLNLQINNSSGILDNEIAESRERLNTAYDSFKIGFGNVSDRKNARAMKGDNGYRIAAALETKNDKGEVTGKADIFTKNTVKPKIIVSHVDTAEEALILSVSEKAKVDFDFMTAACDMEKDKLIAALDGQIYKLPLEDRYVTSDEYLSGNIRKKMAEISSLSNDERLEYEKNYEALKAALPPKVEAKDISVKLGSHWIGAEYVRQFIKEKLNPDLKTLDNMDVQYSAAAGTWKIEGVSATAKKSYESQKVYGTERKHAYEIIEGILNNADLKVKDRVKDEFGRDIKDENGRYVLVINEAETKAVRQCARLIQSEFKDWIFKDPDRREKLVEKYNEIYNSIRHREYDGSHLNFVGMNTEVTLKEHQKNAIARGLYGGNTLLAHAVGAGKSATRS